MANVDERQGCGIVFQRGNPTSFHPVAQCHATFGRARLRAILDDVRARGDAAVLDACEKFEKRRPQPLFKIVDGEAALARLPADARGAAKAR